VPPPARGGWHRGTRPALPARARGGCSAHPARDAGGEGGAGGAGAVGCLGAPPTPRGRGRGGGWGRCPRADQI
jgi:hypothetical protein